MKLDEDQLGEIKEQYFEAIKNLTQCTDFIKLPYYKGYVDAFQRILSNAGYDTMSYEVILMQRKNNED